MNLKTILIIALGMLIFACEKSSVDKAAPTKHDAQNTAVQKNNGKESEKPVDTIAAAQKPEVSADKMASAETQQLEDPALEKTPMPAEREESAPASPVESETTDTLTLAKKSGCLACHKIDKKLVGPSWTDVAKRYANDSAARTYLINKVSKGGSGNWTEVVGNMAMPPYSPRVPQQDIEKLVDFILSLP